MFKYKKSNLILLYKYLLLLLVISIILSPLRIYKVSGESMMPTLSPGDLILCLKLKNQEFNKGDVVVAYVDKKAVVKRIVATGGDDVKIEYGYLVVNGNRVRRYRSSLPIEQTLFPNQMFIIGDNINKSNDSMDYGPIESFQIDSKVLFSFKRKE